MSELQEVEVLISPGGRLKVYIQGVKGESCLNITSKIEQLLGGKMLEREHTFEYDEQPDQQSQSCWSRQSNW